MREIKICHLSDLHVQAGDRFEETMEKLAQVSDEALAAGCHFAVITGDVYDNLGRPSLPAERNALAQAFADFGLFIYIVKGNHDHPGDLEIFDTLPNVTVAERPMTLCVEYAGEMMDLVLIPYPDKRWVQCASEHPIDSEAGRTAVRTGLIEILDAVRTPGRSCPLVIAAHLNVGGAVASSGQPLIGQDAEVSLGDLLDVLPTAVLLGHIHAHQALAPEVVYAGSLVPHDYGEPEAKGWVEWSINGVRPAGKPPTLDARWTFHDLHVTQRVRVGVKLDAQGDQCWSDYLGPESIEGAKVRVRVTVPEAIREMVDVEAVVGELLGNCHTAELRIEVVTEPSVTVRNEEVAKMETMAGKLGVYLRDQEKLQPDDVAALVGHLAAMELPGNTPGAVAQTIIDKEGPFHESE